MQKIVSNQLSFFSPEEVKIGSSERHPQLLDASPSAQADQRLQLTRTSIHYCLACSAGGRSIRRRPCCSCMNNSHPLAQACISARTEAPTADLAFDDKVNSTFTSISSMAHLFSRSSVKRHKLFIYVVCNCSAVTSSFHANN